MKTLPPIIDTHLHFWDLSLFRYPWLDDAGTDHLRHDYLPEHWRADAAGLDIAAAIHIQAEVDHATDPVEETHWLSRLAQQGGAPVPSACIGYADLRAPTLPDILDRHGESALFRGIRQEAWFDPHSRRADVPQENLLDDPAWRAGLRLLADRGLLFELLVWNGQIDQARTIFHDLSDLPLVIEHTALPPDIALRNLGEWRAALKRFADDLPWARFKISGLGMIAPDWTVQSAKDLVVEAIDIFGPDRCMLGSNYPVERGSRGYDALWADFGALLDGFDDAERERIFNGTARAFYRPADASALTAPSSGKQ